MKRTGCLGLLLALMLLLTACSSGAGDSSAGSDYGNVDTAGDSWEMQGAETAGGETGTVSPTAANPSGDKMIYTANLIVETTSFDSAAQALAQATEALSGYFEDQHTTNTGSYRYASYTVRIPAEHFQEFLIQVGQICHVLDSSQNAEDVSEAYYDIEARLTTQRTKLERLQALLGQAEDTSSARYHYHRIGHQGDGAGDRAAHREPPGLRQPHPIRHSHHLPQRGGPALQRGGACRHLRCTAGKRLSQRLPGLCRLPGEPVGIPGPQLDHPVDPGRRDGGSRRHPAPAEGEKS